MPAARHASRSAFIAFAVIAMIGTVVKRGSARRARVASSPSSSGICMSIRIAAYFAGAASAIAMASRPLRSHVQRDPQAPEKLDRNHLVGLVVFGQKRLHAFELTLERRVELAPRGCTRTPCDSTTASNSEDAVRGLRRKTLTPSSAQRASSSFPA